MITVDQQALDQSIAKWNGYITGKIDMLKLSAKEVVKREAQRLVQTLIKITPPTDRAKTTAAAAAGPEKAFASMGDNTSGRHWADYSGTKAGKGDVHWNGFQSDKVYGVAQNKDLTGASADELYALDRKSTR